MQYLVMILIAVMTIFSIGCTKKNVSYVAHAQTIHPMVIPLGIKIKKGENYYPVPNNIHSVIKSSVTPHDSDLQRLSNKIQLHNLFLQQYSKVVSRTSPILQSLVLIKTRDKCGFKVGHV